MCDVAPPLANLVSSLSTGSEELYRLFLVAVATSAMRHDLRNKLGSLRNASFFLRRKVEGLPVWEEDVRVPRFFQLIDSEIAAADAIVAAGMGQALADPEISRIDLSELAQEVIAAFPPPAGVTVEVDRHGCEVEVAPAEVAIGLRCILSNAYDAVATSGGGRVRVTCGPQEDGRVRIDVANDRVGLEEVDIDRWLMPFATTKPGRVGLGLNIARRVAARAGGTLEVTRGEGGSSVRAALILPPTERT